MEAGACAAWDRVASSCLFQADDLKLADPFEFF